MQSKDIKVQQFIDDMRLGDSKKSDILEKLRAIVFHKFPEVNERMMYGGIMFFLETDFGGIFASKNHISFEFSNGYLFDDPKKLLEGTGKFRRHVKIKNIGDIEIKEVKYFVEQVS